MILRDPYALNRHWWDRDWRPDVNSRDWTIWDFVLADAFQIIQDYTDQDSGQIMWFDQSDDVWWETRSMFSGASAKLEDENEKHPVKPGEKRYAVPTFRDPDNKPTMQEWLVNMEKTQGPRRPPGAEGSRPPTAAELAAIAELQ